jgi:GR25 family glycosyltransferase involved in LPS biosynthesis
MAAVLRLQTSEPLRRRPAPRRARPTIHAVLLLVWACLASAPSTTAAAATAAAAAAAASSPRSAAAAAGAAPPPAAAPASEPGAPSASVAHITHQNVAAWVISLARTPHRYAVFRANSWAHQVFPRLAAFAATDGLALDVARDARISAHGRAAILRGERRSHSGLATRGMAGLYVSHVDVWRAFLASGEPVGLVFEDDALVQADAGPRFDAALRALPNSTLAWDLDLWLLGVVAVLEERPAARALGPGWTRVTNFFGTQAYLLTRRGAQRLVAHAYPMTDQIDAYMARMAALGEVVALKREDGLVDFPQFVFGPLAGVWSTVQQSYCDMCSLPPDWSRAHDEAGWQRCGAALGAALVLVPWTRLAAWLARAARRCRRRLGCGGSGGGGGAACGGACGACGERAAAAGAAACSRAGCGPCAAVFCARACGGGHSRAVLGGGGGARKSSGGGVGAGGGGIAARRRGASPRGGAGAGGGVGAAAPPRGAGSAVVAAAGGGGGGGAFGGFARAATAAVAQLAAAARARVYSARLALTLRAPARDDGTDD